jgi:hypothetical protein
VRRRSVLAAALVLGSSLAGCTASGGQSSAASSATAPSLAPDRTGQAADDSDDDPARYAAAVIRESRPAGIDPQLLMAIVYNESYKPHDPSSQRLWQALNPGASFGIVNMHQAAFETARRGRSFANRQFEELPDDPELALQAAAWYLHDLGRMLPSRPATTLTRDQLLALGYNTGPRNMRLFAKGVTPGPMAQTYLDTLKSNWDKAAMALAKAGG